MNALAGRFSLRTGGKGTYEITSQVAGIVAESGVTTGMATVFLYARILCGLDFIPGCRQSHGAGTVAGAVRIEISSR